MDLPQVVASVLAFGADDRAARHVERLVAQHQVAHRRVLAELHVEHEHRAVVRVRHRCERRRQLRSGGDRFRRRADQGLLVALVVGERHPHLDRPALVGVGERVRGLRPVRDVRIGGAVVRHPLVGVGRVVQPVRVGNGRCVRGQRPAHPRRSGNRRRTRRRRVRPGGDRFRRRAEQGLLVALVVGERHPHLDGPALLGVGQLVARAGRVLDVRIVGAVVRHPLVGVGRVVQTVVIGDGRCVRGQRLAHLRCSGNRRRNPPAPRSAGRRSFPSPR